MVGIYKIISPTGRVYVGQSLNIEHRKQQYKSKGKKQIGPKLYNSLQKYGWDNHIFEIIEECTIEQLNKRETYWKQIELDKVNGNWKQVLFCGLFDQGGGPKSDETKQKMSLSAKGHKRNLGKTHNNITIEKIRQKALGRKFNKDVKIKMSQSKLGNDYALGNKYSDEIKQKISQSKVSHSMYNEEWKEKISKSLKGKTNKIVEQYNINGDFIKEWPSVKEADYFYSKKDSRNISNVCNGRKKTAYGYVWKYKN